MRVGKAFLEFLKAHPTFRGGGPSAQEIKPKELPYGVAVSFARTLAVFKHIPIKTASQKVRRCLV